MGTGASVTWSRARVMVPAPPVAVHPASRPTSKTAQMTGPAAALASSRIPSPPRPGREPPQPQAVQDDDQRTGGHRDAREQRVEVAEGGQRDGDKVVAGRPAEVDVDDAHGGAGEFDGVRDASRVAG